MAPWLLPAVSLTGLLAALLLLYQRWSHPFFWEDLGYWLRLLRAGRALRARMQRGEVSLLDRFLQQAERTPHKRFIVTEEQSLTYRDVERRSGRFARVFRGDAGLGEGDVVALLMSNEPDFVCVWLGLCRLGCEAAFLNSHTRSASLRHCVRSCGATALVVGADLLSSLDDVLSELEDQGIAVWVSQHRSPREGVRSLLDRLELVSGEPLPERPQVDVMSNFLFIFTSGTTGLPKAARVGHLKAIMSMAFLQLCGATSKDTLYITLPLYHMSASLLGVGGCIHLGATCVLKKKFSASQFWKDCVKYNVTVFQYIGELCRYLVHQPVVPEETAHSVRLAAGSGLRTDVWREFARRFGKINIREGYGLTEASVGLLNYTNEIGPVGRASYLYKRNMPFDLLRCDSQTYEPIRTESGRCIKAQTGETGLLVAPLSVRNQFLGYAGNKLQSENKLLRNVFQEGDVYFNTGDLMLHDHRDFLYFRDRIGDTFRWKGENVATTEVSEILSSVEFLQEVNVYGVTVPGYEGRVGMAAIILKKDHELDGSRLYNHLVKRLPSYSCPCFLRVQTSMDMTETFKQQKSKLVQEGFGPDTVRDPLYFLDVSQRAYVPLTSSLYDNIVSGKIRL